MVTVMLYRRPYNNCTLVLTTVFHNCSDIGRISTINTWRAQLDTIQTINTDDAGFDVVCAASDEATMESACNAQRQIYLRNKLSTQFTNICVQKSVFARRLTGLDRLTWIIDKLGILEQIHPG